MPPHDVRQGFGPPFAHTTGEDDPSALNGGLDALRACLVHGVQPDPLALNTLTNAKISPT
jgi:hypothetical protein